MKRRFLLQGGGAVVLAGCLTACSTTSSGPRLAPERQIDINAEANKVKAEILGELLPKGYSITRDTEYVLALSRPSTDFWAVLLLSSNYDSRVEARITFSFVGTMPTKVLWQAALITNPGSAFERPTDVTNNPSVDNIQVLLGEIKARLEARK